MVLTKKSISKARTTQKLPHSLGNTTFPPSLGDFWAQQRRGSFPMCSHHSCISGSYFHTSAALISQLDVQFPYDWWWNERSSRPCFWLPSLYQQNYKGACSGAATWFINLCVPPSTMSHGKSLAEHTRGASTPPSTFLFRMVFPREAKKSHTINPILNRWHRR